MVHLKCVQLKTPFYYNFTTVITIRVFPCDDPLLNALYPTHAGMGMNSMN